MYISETLKDIIRNIPLLGYFCQLFINWLNGDRKYQRWIHNIESINENIKSTNFSCKHEILLSIIMPIYRPGLTILQSAIDSVLVQSYKKWELCIVDDYSNDNQISNMLYSYASKHKSIKIYHRKVNGGIAIASNDAVKLATGDYILLLDHDDVLSSNALSEIHNVLIEKPETDVLYSDEDCITESGRKRFAPNFKPDWSPDTLMSYMYPCHLLCLRKELVNKINGFRISFEGSQDYDLLLRISEITNHIIHIPKILYHWRKSFHSTAGNGIKAKPYAAISAILAKKDALVRRGLEADIIYDDKLEQSHVQYKVTGNPLVSIIIPTRDHVNNLTTCIKSIYNKTEYKNYEVILIENNSNHKTKEIYNNLKKIYNFHIILYKDQFNYSRMNNIASLYASGEYIVFLNNDTEIIEPRWLSFMLGMAQQRHIGAVGAKLLYPNSLIQHSGIIFHSKGPGNAFSHMRFSTNNLRCQMDTNWLAVTGACMMISKNKFYEIGGFDESFPIAYNDIALCIELYQKGYYNVVKHDAILMHKESCTRGKDSKDSQKSNRLNQELNKLYDKYTIYFSKDPFYNINLSQNRGDFSI